MEQERMKVLLQNALGLLEENYGEKIMESDLADELGITQEEYDELLADKEEELGEDEYLDRVYEFDEYVKQRLEKEKGLINVCIEGLTQAGEEKAREIYSRHRLLTDFFEKIAEVPRSQAEENACRVEHAIDEDIVAGIRNWLEKNK